MVMPCGSSTGSPSSTTVPRSGLIRRISSRATVDLPQPDSPTTPRVSPFATDRVRSSTARTTLRPWPKMPPPTGKCLRKPAASSSGWAGPPRSSIGFTVSMSAPPQAFTSMAARKPSLMRLKQIEVMKIITPGSAANTGLT